MASGLITSWQIEGETMETVTDFIFWGSKITADGDCSHESKRHLLLGRKAMTNPDSILKSRCYFANKSPSSQSYGFSSSHVWMWELDCKESSWTVVLEKTLESPWKCKEIQPVHPKGNQSEYSLAGLLLKLKLQYFGPPNVKNWLTGKDPDAGKDWRQEEKGMTEDEMVGWHHWFNGHEFEQGLGVGDGQESLVCCSPWSRKELDTTEGLNWTVREFKVCIFIKCGPQPRNCFPVGPLLLPTHPKGAHLKGIISLISARWFMLREWMIDA